LQRQFIRTYLKNKIGMAYSLSVLFLLASILLAISIGTVSIPISNILRMLGAEIFHFAFHPQPDEMQTNILMNIRLPRVILAGLVGASLAIAGAAFQGLLRNPLADPYTLGVSSGASVGAVGALFFHLSLPVLGTFTLPMLSILASIGTVFFILLFARTIERSMQLETIILTGIIVSSFLGAVISLMIALTGDGLREIIGWLLGSVSMRGWEYIRLIFPFFVIGSFLLIWNGKELNAMSFGEERAHHLGIHVQRRKNLILLAGSILTGAAVAVSGTIGFVGLVVPHFNRLLWGPDHKHLLPLSVLTGGGFLILADLVSRIIIAPTELPIGVITALIGAPCFAIILVNRRRERRG
jgi:iron complex transport system permease protein